MEIDRAGAAQRFPIAFEYRPEHGQERFRPLAVGEGCRALGDFCEGQPGALEVLQERREQSRERVDPALLFEDPKQVVPGDRREDDAMGAELLRQVAQQVAIGVLVAEGFDQHGAVLFMDPALPIHLTVVLVVVDERRGLALGVEPEMLDVDAVIGEMKVGLVLALLRRGGIVLVGRFVFVGDAVEIEGVRDLAFLVALDFLALQGADVVAADVGPVFAPVFEFVLALVGRELVAEPFQHGSR